MKNFPTPLLCFLLIALLAVPAAVSENAEQAPASSSGVPDRLLQGISDFQVALTIQGDLRGNFGPCG